MLRFGDISLVDAETAIKAATSGGANVGVIQSVGDSSASILQNPSYTTLISVLVGGAFIVSSMLRNLLQGLGAGILTYQALNYVNNKAKTTVNLPTVIPT